MQCGYRLFDHSRLLVYKLPSQRLVPAPPFLVVDTLGIGGARRSCSNPFLGGPPNTANQLGQPLESVFPILFLASRLLRLDHHDTFTADPSIPQTH
jgi:hypothetical protein